MKPAHGILMYVSILALYVFVDTLWYKINQVKSKDHINGSMDWLSVITYISINIIIIIYLLTICIALFNRGKTKLLQNICNFRVDFLKPLQITRPLFWLGFFKIKICIWWKNCTLSKFLLVYGLFLLGPVIIPTLF